MSTTLTPGSLKAAAELFPHRHQMMIHEYATIIDRLAVDPALAQLRARVAELEQIVAASLKAAPVGHIPTHTAERLPEIIADIATACSEQSEEREQAEARVKELEEKAERYRLTTLRQDATIAELATDGNAATLAANLAIVSQRNAELVAALPEMIAMARAWRSTDGDPATDFVRRLEALARAESATPDHIPDAAKMVSATPAKHCEDCAPEFGCWDGGESCYKQPLQSSTPAKHPDTEGSK